MGDRMQKITPYNDSQGPSDVRHSPEKSVKVRSNFSNSKTSNSDALYKALKGYPPILPEVHHFLGHQPPRPTGARYSPAGEFGKPVAHGHTRATDLRGHRSAPGHNALGSNMNRRGGNPLGNAPNRRGSNPLGHPNGRQGENPLGHPNNRMGGNALGGSRPAGGSFRGRG